MPQDLLQRAKERFADAKEQRREQDRRILEDLRFSNPSAPEQWDPEAVTTRRTSNRPLLTLDRTNQFIQQVVNDARQNKPGIHVVGVDSKSDPKVAETLSGVIRHIEARSRATIAYDTAIDLSARCGLGWIRVIPEVCDYAKDEQEIRILRVTDPRACVLDAESTEPDGIDAMCGFVETRYHPETFKRKWPKAKANSWDGESSLWFGHDFVTVCEYFEIEEISTNLITAIINGETVDISEEEYWRIAKETGQKPIFIKNDPKGLSKRKQKWVKLSGADVLDETDFPCQYVPIVPVLGYELWVDGERFVCGLTRRLMDGQRLHNYQMSAAAEFLGSQPKAPLIASQEAIEGFEAEWRGLATGNPSYLPYNAVADSDGRPLPPPQRLMPPPMPGSFFQMGQLAVTEMEASVGMYKSALGQNSSSVSGKAKLADQRESDTSTFHFIDNQARSIEQVARICVDMIPQVYKSGQVAQIIGIDDSRDMVRINTDMSPAKQEDASGKLTAINPQVGKYDVRVKVGPSYTTQRVEAADDIVALCQGNPALAAAMTPLLAQMRDLPYAEQIKRIALSLLPPNVQKAYEEGAQQEIPPQVAAQMQAMQQGLQQAVEHIKQLQAENRQLAQETAVKVREVQVKEMDAETKRLQALGTALTPEQVQAITLQTVMQVLTGPAPVEPVL